MTTFQADRHLVEQLDSILAQSRLPDELVVFDDASTDDTLPILERFAAHSPIPVRLHGQPHNTGARRNVQEALGTCEGRVVVLADHDDVWEPEKLAAIESAFSDPRVTLWFSNALLVDDHGRPQGRTTWEAVQLTPEAARSLNTSAGLRRLLYGSTVTGATMAVRRDVVDLALPLPEELEGPDHLFLHDGWLAVLAAASGRIAVDPRCLTMYRQHPAQITQMSMAADGEAGDASRSLDSVRRRDQLKLDHARVRLVAERIRCRGTSPTAAVEHVLDLERFLDVRLLPRAAPRRPARVLRELARGGYARHARGLRTAVRDLVRPSA